MMLFSLAIRLSACLILSILVVAGAAPEARAAKNYCRRIQLTGTAGTNNKPVFFYVKNQSGTVVLSQSCSITADDNEADFAYVKRLPFAWGEYPGNCPNPDPDASGFDPDDPLTQRCVDYVGGSCKIKFRVSPKDTGSKKKYAEICCYEEADCGVKLGTTDPTPIPITIQVEKEGSGQPCPDPNNCEDCDLCVVDPDPLGVVQLPSPAGAKCRDSLATGVDAYINGATKELVACHRARIAGKIPPATDCNSVATTEAGVATTVAGLAADITEAALGCQAERSPTALGYDSCPAPCDGIGMGGCSAGNGAAVCSTDRDCDTAPGSGDGRCGDWSQVATCLTCVAENTVTTAVQDVYGTPSVGLPPDTQDCQHTIGSALLDLIRVSIGETSNCQKKLDTGKLVLPSGVTSCDDYDPKGTVAGAEAKITDIIQQRCDAGMIAMLDAICSPAVTPSDVAQCTIDNADVVTEDALVAVVPSEANACGDNERQGFEECDGTDDSACDGLCQGDCTCPPPVCGNNIVESGEQCDGTADAACPGLCMPTCQCGILSPVSEELSSCDPAVLDRYTFPVTAGENVIVQADTVSTATAADLCFGPGSGCNTGDGIAGDNEVPCAFPSPLVAGCPQAAFLASGTGSCVVEVTECTGDCASQASASYQLSVTRDGNPALVQIVADDQAIGPCLFVTAWGSQGTGNGQFDVPYDVALDSSGNVYVADAANARVQKFTSTGAFITKWGTTGTGNGQFMGPTGIVVDGGGNVYTVDQGNHRIQKFTSAGTFLTAWGSMGTGDGQFMYPGDVAVAGGDVYVSDGLNHRVQKFTSAGTFIAKWGSFGSGNGQFDNPAYGIAVDGNGDVYVSDGNNHRVQKFSATGAFITKWGSFGSTNGQFNFAQGVVADGSGDVYVVDGGNARIQKFSTAGTFLAKWGSPGGGNGEFNAPTGIALDAGGNMYVADTSNHRIQKFSCPP